MIGSSGAVVDLDLRLVRRFVAVAEMRHFGRAAAALHVAQPSLSRQIQQLELQLGAQLLERTAVGARLTEAGAVFLPSALTLLESADRAAAETRAAANPSRLRIGYTTDLIVTPAVEDLRRRLPEVDTLTRHLGWNDASLALLDHRIDIVVTREPLPRNGLEVVVLYEEPRVLLVAEHHRLAGRASLRLQEFREEPLPRIPDAAWNAYWRIDPRPDGTAAPEGPLVDTLEDKLEMVATGRAVSIVPFSNHLRGLRPDLVAIPIEDVPPSAVVAASRAGDPNPLVASFRASAWASLGGLPRGGRLVAMTAAAG